MRYAVAVIGSMGSVGLIIVSIMMNFRFGQQLGKSELDGLIYGIASASVDGFKVILPFIVAWSWRYRRPIAGLAGLGLFLVFTVYSFTSSLGFSATNRAQVVGERTKNAQDYQDLRARYQRLVRQRKLLPAHRPVRTLVGLLRSQHQHRRWTSTNGCKDATVEPSRRFCEQYFALKAELATAQSARKLNTEIDQLANRLAGFAGGAATLGNADPQVRILTDLSGLADNRVQLALTLILAVMVEFGSGLGLFVTFGHGHIGHRIQPRLVSELAIIDPTAEKHTASDQDWARQRLILDPHAHTLAVALYEDYCWWCKKEGRRDPISPAEFEPWLRSQGLDVSRKLAGRNHYLGVRLRTTNDVVADFRAEETLATA